MFIIKTVPVSSMINIFVVGLTSTKLVNLANTKVKREVLVIFTNFSPLGVHLNFQCGIRSTISILTPDS